VNKLRALLYRTLYGRGGALAGECSAVCQAPVLRFAGAVFQPSGTAYERTGSAQSR
jgi:hypothetical protein